MIENQSFSFIHLSYLNSSNNDVKYTRILIMLIIKFLNPEILCNHLEKDKL